jgi:DNA polymerase
MVVGDLPSEADDQQGQPFTGPEGVLLDNMLKAVGVRRQGPVGSANATASADVPEACLTHAVKCRPLNGRNPETAELATCAGYMSRQVALAQPRVILAMGRFAIQSLLGSTEPMGKLRGRLHDFQGVPVVVTYPPSSLLRNPADKAKAWADLVLALSVAQG